MKQGKKIMLIIWFIFISAILSFTSCKKYLDVKSSKNIRIPTLLSDLQAVLDNVYTMNAQGPWLAESLADNYYNTSSTWESQPIPEVRLIYIWDKDVSDVQWWNLAYQGLIYYSNVVLDQLPFIEIKENEIHQYNSIKGSALFYRAFGFYYVAQLWCKPYSTTASTDPGIVLKLTAAIEDPSIRASVEDTYSRIIKDLKEATLLLPKEVLYPTRPSKAAAYGMLARVYLAMRNYPEAKIYADSCLQLNNQLMDYNDYISSPFELFNKETLYWSVPSVSLLTYRGRGKVDSTLYNSYDENDLRRQIYFEDIGDGTYEFKGSYGGRNVWEVFDGIAVDEIYLIRAECAARLGQKEAALSDLNTLMVKRWKNNGTWTAFDAVDAKDALEQILTERRKELLFRGLRWSDLRRLNLEGANIQLTRVIYGTTYTLPPDDPRWVLLIPVEVLQFNPGMQQNPR